jgi:tryptophan 2,3-dioxygenase
MSFGLQAHHEPRLTYGGYLRIEDLLQLQRLLSDPPQHDETLFIIIHQVYELWFKQLLHELDTIVRLLDADAVLEGHRLLRRCIEIQRVLISQISVLETMTPMDFLAFRDHLLPASGFQSWQFRELEFLAGLKQPALLRFFANNPMATQALQRRLDAPTLGDCFFALLSRHGLQAPPGTDHYDQRVEALRQLYEQPEQRYGLFLLAEGLIEFDEMFSLWRIRHVKMVERMIGSKKGTGGSEGVGYLKTTVPNQFFPELWEVRTRLSKVPGYGSSLG